MGIVVRVMPVVGGLAPVGGRVLVAAGGRVAEDDRRTRIRVMAQESGHPLVAAMLEDDRRTRLVELATEPGDHRIRPAVKLVRVVRVSQRRARVITGRGAV